MPVSLLMCLLAGMCVSLFVPMRRVCMPVSLFGRPCLFVRGECMPLDLIGCPLVCSCVSACGHVCVLVCS